ncbi:hypothetical protein BU14_0412s0008 [Porphyra umbilicalis]|uniref:Uncharacterized protein n=1 Tax=Porphyra umbilicalis TaxID=2786 RepID=A0A1X6NVQ8_PORUM|nr:hypothetical protein BU14_0412s0008 [Porphyra umbilicalis]|eukprot:OSX72714.1 hypothetical protein BU14_0412s0008 [Porphyra umbilicalis]
MGASAGGHHDASVVRRRRRQRWGGGGDAVCPGRRDGRRMRIVWAFFLFFFPLVTHGLQK